MIFVQKNVCKRNLAGLRLRCSCWLLRLYPHWALYALTLIWEKKRDSGVISLAISARCVERNRCDSGCIAACWSIGVVRTKGAPCKDSPGNTGGAGHREWRCLEQSCWRLCVYTMILLPPDYAVRQENEAAYRQMTEIAKQAESKKRWIRRAFVVACARGRSGTIFRSTPHWWTGKARSADTFRPKANRQRRFWKVSVILHPGFRCVPSAERKFPIQCCAMCFVFSKEALGQSGSGSVLSNQRAWAELLSAEDVETNIDRLLKKSRAWM